MEFTARPKGPSGFTKEKNKKAAAELGIDMSCAVNGEYELARAHCLKRMEHLVLENEKGDIIWNQDDYAFEQEEAVPDSVHPSLWINSRCLYESGIYSVVGKDIVQVRGFDIANITFVRSHTGWIVIDAGSTVEGSRAAVKATEEVLGEQIKGKIRAVIISHSHGDHFGGIAGIVSAEEAGRAEDGKIPIFAPGGFAQAAMDEYVYTGGAMCRRGIYQVGATLPAGTEGRLSMGCGLAQVRGTSSYLAPTYCIEKDTVIRIDGLTVDFMVTDETEAVANMQNYFHDYHALWVADNCIGTLHNIYTMRGAKIRDAKLWAAALYDAYERYGEDAEVIFQGHAWPHWKTEAEPDAVREVLLSHAAAYQFIHDQSLLYIGQGDTADEVAGRLCLPERIARKWYLRPYYGMVDVNARAIYHKYLGFYDGNPVHLHPLTELENAKKFIEYVGSEEAVLEKAAEDLEKGNYQYAAQAANQVVFVNPANSSARYLCADALEQLAYQSESAIARNAYLCGAAELRNGSSQGGLSKGSVAATREGMDNGRLLDYLGMVIDSNRAADINGEYLFSISSGEGGQTDDFLVHFYSGTLLKKQLDGKEAERYRGTSGKQGTQVLHISRRELLNLISKKQNTWEHLPIGQQELLAALQESIVDLDEYGGFHIIEP